ncbi:unnamed protein product [Lymnaea stagnalis]|uniref:Palmitoyltransferase n=1 Tax=Lymnaea stagnalis TaxID=6523 RepID=A0AAV2HYZ3_LYMST
MSALGWVPVISIILIMFWTYYVYVIVLCLFTSQILGEKIILLTAIHPLLFMMMWCLYRACFTAPRSPPARYYLDEAEWSKLSYDFNWKKDKTTMDELRLRLELKTTAAESGYGIPHYCYYCKLLKPDRCHHCSKCNTCVLKMDHHCPWLNNCVGFHNYKYFLQFLGYVTFSIIFVIFTSLRFVIEFFGAMYMNSGSTTDVNGAQIVAMVFVDAIVALTISPLLILHRDLIHHNVTTLENTRPVAWLGQRPDYHTFDLGPKENFLQVFGDRKLCWFFPLFSSRGNGLTFPRPGSEETV